MPDLLITGAGRRAGIAAACALKLARAGWDVGLSCWRLYDRETGPASVDREPIDLVDELRDLGIRAERPRQTSVIQLRQPAYSTNWKVASAASQRSSLLTAVTSNSPSRNLC